MAFFDVLNDLARNIGDKTKDAIEISRLNTKINAEKSAIAEAKRKIGEYYYNRYASGGQVDSEVMEFCTAINEHKKEVLETLAEIERIKAASEAANAAAAAGNSQEGVSGTVCPTCGTFNLKDTRFCKDCGNRLAPPAPASMYCTACGTLNASGAKFCCDCGKKIE